jgi:hypothetical protein
VKHIKMWITYESVFNRPAAKRERCTYCGRTFVLDPQVGWKGTRIVTVETQVSNRRGEDLVRFYHPECAEKEGIGDGLHT